MQLTAHGQALEQQALFGLEVQTPISQRVQQLYSNKSINMTLQYTPTKVQLMRLACKLREIGYRRVIIFCARRITNCMYESS